ncbi:hypothetical protein BD770DRAFT_419400 [Pilaira anomala]|nr:hypothetical protein BD770DRAFT_419400 [Pilaira anomala]
MLLSMHQAKQVIVEQLTDAELETHAAVVYDLVKNYNTRFDIKRADDSVFIDFALAPFVNAVFPVSHMFHFTALEGETNIRPDIKFHTIIDEKKFDCLLIEVKCPKSTSNDDLFKLSIEMQYALNRLVKCGASNPVTYGVLVYGFECSIYKMTLAGPKVYVMMKMKTCFLPRCFEDLHVVIHTISCFLQLRDLVNEEIESIIKNKKEKSPLIDWIRQPIIDFK